MVSDTYPDNKTHKRVLFLYDLLANKRIDIGEFYADPSLSKENRCDLHPRWSRDGSSVSIDSIHEIDRRIYSIDVSKLTK
jgi:Tol biopolymer transport system component